jgi:SAM-dependent methyltransferase
MIRAVPPSRGRQADSPASEQALENVTAPPFGPPTHAEMIFDHLWAWLSRHTDGRTFGSILEVGVGENGFARFYARKAADYVGLDVDNYEANYRDLENVRIITYDGRDFPLPDASFDLVASHSVFEHVMDVDRVVHEVWRVLRPGGLAFISIDPMYYASWGSHGRYPDDSGPLPPWEHLDPASPFYMVDCPPQMAGGGAKGCYLNRLTMGDFLYRFAQVPFSIDRLDRLYETFELPDFLAGGPIPETTLRNNDFRILLRKDAFPGRV